MADAFTITASNAAQLTKQIDSFVATLPEGQDFLVNFDRAQDGTWWISYGGQYVVDRLTFSDLVRHAQQLVDDAVWAAEASSAMKDL